MNRKVLFALLGCLVLLAAACRRELDPALKPVDYQYLKEHIFAPEKKPEIAGDWPTNRRYYFILRALEQAGFERCDGFKMGRPCKKTDTAMLARDFRYYSTNDVLSTKPNRGGTVKVIEAATGQKPVFYASFLIVPHKEKKANQLVALLELIPAIKAGCPALSGNILFYEADGALHTFLKDRGLGGLKLGHNQMYNVETGRLTSFFQESVNSFAEVQKAFTRLSTALCRG